VSHDERDKLTRLQVILTDLLKHQLGESLGQVEDSLAQWRRGELGPFEVHAEVLKHAARAEAMATRITRLSPDATAGALREAFDADLVSRQEFVDLVGQPPEDVEPLGPDEVPKLPEKRAFIEELIGQGPILVYVDARVESVDVPEYLRKDPRLMLRFGYGLTPPIHDLTIDDDGIRGTLTFRGTPYACVLPWVAVYAGILEESGRGMVWPEDMPDELLDQMNLDERASGPIPAMFPGVPGGSGAPGKPTKPEPRKRRASHLKLVD
jgi:stringent starvation protein B